ncbi:MAG TPA: L-glutamate gamma-semialdehyde dehydrogenase [Tenuifilaceae bacterium]|nr:L-glutamate gamma-semialdehyde dehydrogenase [Tenuifilaceae bacterium]HPE18525.1 L-glutamate gamma-semialdehyde dehydrogenase [Tenuifilaceae bacterium]HPJ46830.1 L-glutamate gamma-semialdehyde dehydrogenase [Tenuifilaceae bacterium]HPQ35389.1 L-glutamate gamma-semialdehyde dehydrogenase [Tenuifilaceae bacterium]HRX69187.1 L-glutamate gamma-semialdehyde dehydrogenase [Tenuifilaceae bacterium]
MNNAVYNFPIPENERVLDYLKGSKERIALEKELERQKSTEIEIPLIIGGKEIRTGKVAKVTMPHNHKHVLATYHQATEKEVQMAIDAALQAHKIWSNLTWTIRASILLKAADLIATKYRALMNAATMLGQSKNIYQAEIDAVCETVDFLRYNASFASKIYQLQPKSAFNQLNRMEFRALEGFVFSVSPFNFTAIASNLNMAPVMMGNTTVWKPATTALLSNYYLMKIFMEAGVPGGVINFVPGSGSMIGNEVLKSPDLAGIHFTGSNNTFNFLWRKVSENLPNYKSYPRLVGETGGKDFIFVHPSADVLDTAVNAIRGSFEFQGQKCSASSRMYVPKSLWPEIKRLMVEMANDIRMGDVADPQNFMNAVIDEKAFDFITSYIDMAKNSADAEIVAGGTYDKSEGYFIRPTIIETTNPHFKTMEEELFGPVLTVYVYEDADVDKAIDLCDTTSPYGLTGAIFGRDRIAIGKICDRLRYAAGNLYFNDKPTGAIVGLQPFGGSRASGTNDKAGGEFNLVRWISPRTIKETFVPATDYKYPYMNE